MALLSPDPTVTGKNLFENTNTFRARDDQSDRKSGASYQHSNFEFSATEANEWVAFWQYLVSVVKSGNALTVRNNTGSTIAAGPVYVSGYDVAQDAWLITKASATGAQPAEMLLLASLATSTNGTAYLAGDWTSTVNTTLAAVGDPVYLSTTAGVGTLTAPSGADQIKQVIGRVKTLAVSGVVKGGIKAPTIVGTSWFQALAITGAKIAAATIDLTTKVLGILPGANGGTNNGFMQFSGPTTSLKTKTVSDATDTIAECGQANTFTAAQIIRGNLTLKDTAGTGAGALKLQDTSGGQVITIATASNEAADRALTIPPLGGNDTIACLNQAQTFTQDQTLASAKSLLFAANNNSNVGSAAAAAATAFANNLNSATGTALSAASTPPAVAASTTAGVNATLQASAAIAGNTNVGAAAGGDSNITSGAAARLTSGNANGGNIVMTFGAGIGTGVTGSLKVGAKTEVVDANNQAWSGLCEGRLTTATGDPAGDTVGNQSTIYFTPYHGNRIALYDGSTKWKVYNFSEVSLSLVALLTSGRPHDVWLYDNAGTLTLEVLAWSSTTARATALSLQDGVYVKSTEKQKRLIGTIYAVSTGATQDNSANRYVWNVCNRIRRHMSIVDATDSWAAGGTNNVWRPARNNTGNSVAYVVGFDTGKTEDAINASSSLMFSDSAGVSNASAGIGIDSSTTNGAQVWGGVSAGVNLKAFSYANYRGVPAGIGFHAIYWVEIAAAIATTTFYGDNGTVCMQSGLVVDGMF